MTHQFPFEKLEIWRLSIDFSKFCYLKTSGFPETEKFGIINQIRRAANSVSANIAEGSCRTGKKDQARFIQTAYASLMEVLNYFVLANELNFLEETDYVEIRVQISELSNKINAYHKYLIRFIS